MENFLVQLSDLNLSLMLPLLLIISGITATGLYTTVRLIDTHLITTDIAHQHICIVSIRLICGRCLKGILRADATEVLAILSKVPHRLAVVLGQDAQF